MRELILKTSTSLIRHAAALLLLGLACRAPASPPAAPPPRPGPAERSAPPPEPPPQAGECGTRPGDWCPAPKGDPCGEHKDLTSCRADARCGGLPYRGESVVACKLDARGFAENCPTVGCVSLPRH